MAPKSLNTSISSSSQKQTYFQCLQALNKIFDEVQSDEYELAKGKAQQLERLKSKLLKKVLKISDEVGRVIFAQTLMRMMIAPFQVKGKNPYVSRLIDFFHTIITWEQWTEAGPSPSADNSSADETFRTLANTSLSSTFMEDDADSLPMLILKQCEKYHGETRNIVRLRLLQTVEKIIPNTIPIQQFKRGLVVRMIRMLITRSKDKYEDVRAVVMKLISHFCCDNVPAQYQTEIIELMVERMAFDPSAAVRVAAVSHLKLTDYTLEHIVERAGDPDSNVRTAALNRIRDSIRLPSLTLEMREAILQYNSTDDSPKNVQKALNGLLQNWLECLKQDPVELLRVLSVRKRGKLCRKALDLLYNQLPEEAYEKISKPAFGDKNYPTDSLSLELTYLWLYMYERFKNEPYVFNKLVISVPEMIEYIMEFVEIVEEEEDLDEDDVDTRAWMLGDMLQIFAFLPNEEGERREVLRVLPTLYSKKRLMDERNSSLAIKLISACSDIRDETVLIDLVNSILDADRSSSSRVLPTQPHDEFNMSMRGLKIEMANQAHKARKLEKERDAAVRDGELEKAQEIQNAIQIVEEEIEKLKVQLNRQNIDSSMDTSVAESIKDDEEPWIFSDKTMLITISMVKTNVLLLDKISDFSRTFYNMYVSKFVPKCKDLKVRALALEFMSIVSLDNEAECAKTASYCLVGLMCDKDVVKVAALKCLYDLVLCYSFAKLGQYPEVLSVLMGHFAKTGQTPQNDNFDNPTLLLKNFLLSYVNDSNRKLVKISVAGVLKLLFRKELPNSSRLIVSFLMKWAIPSHETYLRFKDVEVMIPVYASLGEDEAIEVAKCLITSIRKTLIEMRSRAEGIDEIPHPEIDKIVSLVVKSTDPSQLKDCQRPYIGHETIADGALTELRKIELSAEERSHYAKLLKVLNLQHSARETIIRMKHVVNEIMDFSGRPTSAIMMGFSKYLDSLIQGTEIDKNESDNEDVNGTAMFLDDE